MATTIPNTTSVYTDFATMFLDECAGDFAAARAALLRGRNRYPDGDGLRLTYNGALAELDRMRREADRERG